MQYSTDDLLKLLKNSASFEENQKIYEENQISSDLPSLLSNLLESKNLSKADCIKKSNLDRNYAYQIFDGSKSPSRDKILSLLIGMGCSLDEIVTFLKHAGYPPLYPRQKRDTVILYGISHELSLFEINELLDQTGLPILE